MNISIGSDHAGFGLKERLSEYLRNSDYKVLDKGAYSDERSDYPDFGHAVAQSVLNKESDFGVLICGSGNGISMAANRHKGIRAAISWKRELAEMARMHNDANILVLPARYISPEEAEKCLELFLNTGFEGGRHEDRVNKIEMC